jgi:hypothetical protein
MSNLYRGPSIDASYQVLVHSSSLAKGYDPLYSSSPLASLDGFSRSHGEDLHVMQQVVVQPIRMRFTKSTCSVGKMSTK